MLIAFLTAYVLFGVGLAVGMWEDGWERTWYDWITVPLFITLWGAIVIIKLGIVTYDKTRWL
jgi:hypothetical protein